VLPPGVTDARVWEPGAQTVPDVGPRVLWMNGVMARVPEINPLPRTDRPFSPAPSASRVRGIRPRAYFPHARGRASQAPKTGSECAGHDLGSLVSYSDPDDPGSWQARRGA